MVLQLMWFIMIAFSIGYASFFGKISQLLPAMLKGCEEAIALTLRLGAGYLLFCGLTEIAKAVQVPALLEKLLRPLLKRLMPQTQNAKIREAVTLNLSMNMLGIGNAATPLGMEAVRLMDEEGERNPKIRQDLYMLLILNATSIQLLPTTILALRTAMGSPRPNAILFPTLVCTAVSTTVGIGTALIWRRRKE